MEYATLTADGLYGIASDTKDYVLQSGVSTAGTTGKKILLKVGDGAVTVVDKGTELAVGAAVRGLLSQVPGAAEGIGEFSNPTGIKSNSR